MPAPSPRSPDAPLGLVDTHIHLGELPQWEVAVDEAVAAGVTSLIAMGVDLASSRDALAMAERHPAVWAAVGHHPMNLGPPDLAGLRELCAHPRAVAVGEVGLDRSADEHNGPWPEQAAWFAGLCALARGLDLPVCVHIRDSASEVHEELARHPGLRGVIHYWSLDTAWARRFLDLGFHISFAGTITRAAKEQVREVARMTPEDRILVETDAPWGTPRGRSGPMRPAWMVDTAAALAEVRGTSLERLADVLRANTRALFTRLRI